MAVAGGRPRDVPPPAEARGHKRIAGLVLDTVKLSWNLWNHLEVAESQSTSHPLLRNKRDKVHRAHVGARETSQVVSESDADKGEFWLTRSAQFLFKPVYSVFECAEFRLLCAQLLLGFRFCGLPLLLFSRQAFEF